MSSIYHYFSLTTLTGHFGEILAKDIQICHIQPIRARFRLQRMRVTASGCVCRKHNMIEPEDVSVENNMIEPDDVSVENTT
jgi:hypothetical protein